MGLDQLGPTRALAARILNVSYFSLCTETVSIFASFSSILSNLVPFIVQRKAPTSSELRHEALAKALKY